MPEVPAEHACETDVPTGPVPEGDGCLSVVALPRIHIFLGPQVDHISDGVHEGIGEGGSEVAGDPSQDDFDWEGGSVAGSPQDRHLVDEPVVAVEGGERGEDVFGVEGEGVAEQIVGAFLEWDATKCVEVAAISFLEL